MDKMSLLSTNPIRARSDRTTQARKSRRNELPSQKQGRHPPTLRSCFGRSKQRPQHDTTEKRCTQCETAVRRESR